MTDQGQERSRLGNSASKETSLATPPLRYTVKCRFTMSGLNSSLLPNTTTTPLISVLRQIALLPTLAAYPRATRLPSMIYVSLSY